MRLRFPAVILLLVAGAAGTALWLIKSSNHPEEVADQEEQLVQQTLNPQRARFEFQGCALLGRSSKDRSGFKRGSAQTYMASDGVCVLRTGLDYASPAQARKELRKRLTGALRIVERGPNLDEKRKRVGERVVAFFPSYYSVTPPDSNKPTASVLSTNKRSLVYIESWSMQHVLEFEKPEN